MSTPSPFSFLFKPRSPGQVEALDFWSQSRILFLRGPAGTGKTGFALGAALTAVLRDRSLSLLLARPMVACDEETGFLPGDLAAKLGPWMGAFRDVLSSLSFSTFEQLVSHLSTRMEIVPVGMLRGRTIRNAILVVDEAQNCSERQLDCIVKRIGKNGRIIIAGDTAQTDTRDTLAYDRVVLSLSDIDGITAYTFDGDRDQLRDPLVAQICARRG